MASSNVCGLGADAFSSSPIFTYENKGLSGRPNPQEYISIRDQPGIPTPPRKIRGRGNRKEPEKVVPGWRPTETVKHGALYCTPYKAYQDEQWAYMTDKTLVHFTAPHCHEYKNISTPVGQLDEDSLIRLQNLYCESMLHMTNLALYKGG